MPKRNLGSDLALKKIEDQWWIINHDPTMGPYELRPEAENDLAGVRRFYDTMYVSDPEAEALDALLS